MQKDVEKILGIDLANELRKHFRTVVSKNFDKLMLVTRKGYWIYQEIMQSYHDPEICNFKNVYSDRYLMKALNDDWVKDQRVFLMDDTINHGYSIFRFYCILKKKGVREVVPIVFALSTEYPQSDADQFMEQIFCEVNPEMESAQAKEEADAAIKEFYDKLYCGRYMTPAEIGNFCVKEMELFQRSLCPMSIDLPIIVSKTEGGEALEDSFVISEEKFQSLCRCDGEKNWNYVTCGYVSNEFNANRNVVHGKVRETIQCNYFEYRDKNIEPMFDTFLQNMVVKCKYNRDGDGSYHVIFTPFAIVRSWDKEELKKAVKILLVEESGYKEKLLNKLEEKKENNNAWVAALRSVIYILSLYVGEKFREYLKKQDIQSGYDSFLIKRNSEPDYIKMMHSYEKKAADEVDSVDSVVIRYSKALSNNSNLKATEKQCLNAEKKKPNLQDAYYNCIWPMLQEKQNDRKIPNIISLENMEDALENRYSFEEDSDKRHMVTGIMLIMLEISTFGNMVEVSGDKVIRGFRRGENSQLLIAPAAQVCYSCAEILYVTAGEEGYHSFFDRFFEVMREFVVRCGIFREDGDEESFDQGIKWFRDFEGETLYAHIEGKRFLLRDLNDKEEKVRNMAKKAAEEMVVWQDGYRRKLYF